MRIQTIWAVLFILPVWLFFPGNEGKIQAAPLNPVEVAKKLQMTYDKSVGLQADFHQETLLKMTRRKKTGSGRVTFLKPSHMRWDYLTPDHQILISDGKTISMYFENERQLIITSAEDYLQSDVTYSFFSGTGDILRDFEVLAPDIQAGKSEDSYLIKLIPKNPHPHAAYLYLWVDVNTFLIQRLQIIDHFDTITDIVFDNLRVLEKDEADSSLKINSGLFTFIPPPGTEIIRQ